MKHTRFVTPSEKNILTSKRHPLQIGRLLPLGAVSAGTLALILAANPALAQPEANIDQAATAQPKEESLPEVKVKAERDSEAKGYQGDTTSVGKLQQLPRDIPQSVTVVTEQLMKDRNATTFKEALRNVAGLTFNAGEGGRIGDNITIRGYSAAGDLYLDGMRDVAQYNREVFNLQQLDILRGSASMLFGRGSTGGIINQVSKQPSLADRNEVAFTLGSFDYKRLTADLNKVVGQDAAVRVNLMKTDTDSFRDAVNQERWGVAPSVRWGIGTRNEFALSYYYLKEDNIPDYGVPYFQGRPLDVPVTRFYGMANADYERNQTGIATASYIHRFDPDTSVRTVLRVADYERDLRVVAPRLTGTGCVTAAPTVITGSTIVCRGRQARGGEEDTITSQTDFTTKLNTGGIKHQLLAGLELMQEKAHRWNYVNTGINPPTTVGNPDPNPPLASGFLDRTPTGDVTYKAHTIGLYAQDVMELVPMWKLVLGARHDQLKADYARPAPAGDLSRTDNVWSYRAGVMYQPDLTTYYVSYGTSFNPSAELYQLDDRSANTPPEKNRNIEVGAKWDLIDGNLSLRTAIFRSEKTNERNTDLASTQYLLSGKRHTDGIEFEGVGRITPDWEVFSALALMTAEIDVAAAQQANTLGNTPLNTPKYTANLWNTYKLGGGWKIGGGVEGAGRRYANNTNINAVPSYWRWDAMAQYGWDKYSVKLNVLNLLDKDYYEGVYSGHSIPGTKRAVQLTFGAKF